MDSFSSVVTRNALGIGLPRCIHKTISTILVKAKPYQYNLNKQIVSYLYAITTFEPAIESNPEAAQPTITLHHNPLQQNSTAKNHSVHERPSHHIQHPINPRPHLCTPSNPPTQPNMPATPKSFFPAFAAFLLFGITYTTIVASNEGAAMDGARARWQRQHRRMWSGGVDMEMDMQENGAGLGLGK
jgi:hypothetical protein